ncbi:MAG: HupE/UreJ family protein [Gemmatimonadota bacterium]|nr:MAG: HupE/UreJ family protein [Gemmatimonadota bacterium]
MRTRRALLGVAICGLMSAIPARADDVRPVHIQIREREPGSFLVQWRVPQVIPVRAMPSPVLPDHCEPEGERVIIEQSGSWINRQTYRCSDGVAGYEVGIRFPVPNPSITTVFRVELLSGERFAHALDPLEDSWLVPAANVGAFTAWMADASTAVLRGARHILGDWVHIAFLIALVLLAGMVGSIRLVGAFAIGQGAAVLLTAIVGRSFSSLVSELCVAIAVVLLAREALRPERDRTRVEGLAVGAGLFHGLALGGLLPAVMGAGLTAASLHLVLVLGMDGTLLLVAGVVSALSKAIAPKWNPAWFRPTITYTVAATAVAAALSLVSTQRGSAQDAVAASQQLPASMGSSRSVGGAGSRRLAPQIVDAPIQSFLAIEPFEIRHEIQFQLRDVLTQVSPGLRPGGFVEIAQQAEVLSQLSEFAELHTALEIDGELATGLIDRASFLTVDFQGVLPRQEAVREPVDEALVGVTLVYLTPSVPQEVALNWDTVFDLAETIPATVIDPESSQPLVLSTEEPTLQWENELLDDPIPAITEVVVEPAKLPLPLVSLPFLAIAVALGVSTWHNRHKVVSFAAVRVMLAAAILVGPLAQVTIALPVSVSAVSSENKARRILASVLPNVYRALEFRSEEAAYDRLAVAVTGETLTDVYLEHRRSLVMEERGGARARVDAVEVTEVRDVEPRGDGGFDAVASWMVGGNVTHFGHRHFRQNRYDARVSVAPVDGTWKIRTIEVLGEERVR